MHVPKVSRQLRQQTLYVRPFAVPGNQAMNGEGVTKVVKAGLEASPIVALHTGLATQSAEESVCGPSCYPIPRTGDEEWSIRLGRMVLPALARIRCQHMDEVRADRYEPCLVELAFTNLENFS